MEKVLEHFKIVQQPHLYALTYVAFILSLMRNVSNDYTSLTITDKSLTLDMTSSYIKALSAIPRQSFLEEKVLKPTIRCDRDC